MVVCEFPIIKVRCLLVCEKEEGGGICMNVLDVRLG